MWKSNGHTTRYIMNGQWVEKEKKSYSNMDTAIEVARSMNMRPETIHKAVAYKCKVCGQYHIGRTKKEITDKDREKYQKVQKKLYIIT